MRAGRGQGWRASAAVAAAVWAMAATAAPATGPAPVPPAAAVPGRQGGTEDPYWKFSCYAYRDIDRDGVFDLGDRPFAGLPVVLTLPDGRETVQFSNIDGFANFITRSGGGPGIDVGAPGPMTVGAEPPPGWMITGGAGTTWVFRDDPVVPGGLGVEDACIPIGIAPLLAVEGRLPGAASAVLAGPDGAAQTLALDAEGRFALETGPGDWILSAAAPGEPLRPLQRFAVATEAIRLAALDPAAHVPEGARGPVRAIGFDDLVGAGGILEIPSGYGGLNWRNMIAVHNRFYDGPGYVNGTRSGEFVAYNSSGAPAAFWRDRPFDFRGAALAVAWPRGAEGDVVVTGWRGAVKAYSDRLALSPAGGVTFAADWRDVTRVEFSHDLHERIVLDDVRIADE